jgi:LysR family nitrogen assimilation transcriptional regulator
LLSGLAGGPWPAEAFLADDRIRMDLASLKLFAVVAEHGSLTRAAVALGTVPSALSRKLAVLERDCGGRLFHRTGRGLTLTELGERILPRISSLLAGLDELSHEVRSHAGVPGGAVRIGLLASMAHPLVDRLFREMRARHPEVRLNVFGGSNGQLDEWLASGRIDMAVLFRYGRAEVGNEQSLGVVDTYLVGPAGDALTRAPTVKFDQLDQLPLVLPGPPNGLRVILDQLARRKGISLSVVLEANSLPVQKDIVAGGGVYTVLAGYAAGREVREGRLQAARLVSPGIERIVTLGITNQRPATLASREVARLICRIVDDMSDSIALRHVGSRARNVRTVRSEAKPAAGAKPSQAAARGRARAGTRERGVVRSQGGSTPAPARRGARRG